MAEDVALAKDGELLAGQHPVLLREVHVELLPIHGDHEPLHGGEGPDDIVKHEPEGGADLIGSARPCRPRPRDQPHERERHRAPSPPPITPSHSKDHRRLMDTEYPA